MACSSIIIIAHFTPVNTLVLPETVRKAAGKGLFPQREPVLLAFLNGEKHKLVDHPEEISGG